MTAESVVLLKCVEYFRVGQVRVQGELLVNFHSLSLSLLSYSSQSVCVGLFGFSWPGFLLGQLGTFALIKLLVEVIYLKFKECFNRTLSMYANPLISYSFSRITTYY